MKESSDSESGLGLEDTDDDEVYGLEDTDTDTDEDEDYDPKLGYAYETPLSNTKEFGSCLKYPLQPKHNFFTSEETNAIVKGRQQYGNQWALIKQAYPVELQNRTARQIKDRHVTMVKQEARNKQREKEMAEETEKEETLNQQGAMEQDQSEAAGMPKGAHNFQDGGEEFYDEETPEVVSAIERNTQEGLESGTVEEDSAEEAEEGTPPTVDAARDEQVATKDKAKKRTQKVNRKRIESRARRNGDKAKKRTKRKKRKSMLSLWKEQRARRKACIQREQR